MSLATLESLQAWTPATRRVDVPAWGDMHVYVRALSGYELDDIAKLDAASTGEARQAAVFVTLVACAASGERLYSAEHVDALLKMPFEGLKAIMDAGLEFNGLSAAGRDELKKK